LSSQVSRSFIWIFLSLLLSVKPSAAQAAIDPSLPEAPLEHKRQLFLFAGYGTVMDPNNPVPPLRTEQKFEMAYRMTVDPSLFFRAALVSGFDKAADVGPDYGSGWSGFGQLYGYNAANIASSYFFGNALIPTIFHQDPRYFRKGSGTVKSRIGWALRSQIVAFSDRGTEMPNYGGLLGLSMSSALSAAYLPPQNISFANTMKGWAIREGVKTGLDVSREFGGLGQLARLMKRRSGAVR
jgi:hypothetical protein